ncbi:MAG TPA: flagellar biosynthetic protein FliQ [Candidatus Limnocylindrales bacterium]
MSGGEVGVVLSRALWAALAVAGPIVLSTMIVGLVVSILQAATQVNEATLTFVPKLLVAAAVLVILGPAMVGQLTDFTRLVFSTAATVAR